MVGFLIVISENIARDSLLVVEVFIRFIINFEIIIIF